MTLTGSDTDHSRIHFKSILLEKELWILIGLGIAFFYRVIFLRETFFYRDLHLHYFMRKQLFSDFLASGQLPLWDMFIHGGQAYIADISNSALYPLNVLYVFLSPARAFNITIILSFLLCSVFAYFFSRVLGFRPVSSLITGIIYSFCGYTLSLINLLGLFLAMPYIPLLLMLWHLFLMEGRRRWFVLAVFAGAFQVFAGAPEINIITFLMLIGWTFFYPYPFVSYAKRTLLWVFLILCVAGTASVQILPTLEMVMESGRGNGMTYQTFSKWSLYPARLPELFVHGFFGYADTLQPDIYYWGGTIMSPRTPYILSIYLGCIVIFLAIAGVCHRDNINGLPKRVRYFLALIASGSLILCMGRFLPFYHMIYDHVPLITLFRYPIKFFAAGIFPIALLAGFAADIHFCGSSATDFRTCRKTPWIPSRYLLSAMWFLCLLFCVFTLAYVKSTEFSSCFYKLFFNQQEGIVANHFLKISFLQTTALWLVFTILYQYRKSNQTRLQSWLLAIILAADLIIAGNRINPTAPEFFFTDTPAVVKHVKNEINDGRLFRQRENASIINVYAPTNHVMWLSLLNLETLNHFLGAQYKLPVIFHKGFTDLANKRISRLTEIIESLPWEKRLPLLSAGAVTVILTSDKIEMPGIRLVSEILNQSTLPLYLYKNEGAAPRLEFITDAKFAVTDDEALQTIMRPDFDPRKSVVLQEAESTLFQRQSKDVSIPAQSEIPDCRNARIVKIRSTSGDSIFAAASDCDGFLVFSEPFYPGWRIYVDGTPAPVLRANYAFTATPVKAGMHKIRRCYRPYSFMIGTVGSLLFFCALCASLFARSTNPATLSRNVPG